MSTSSSRMAGGEGVATKAPAVAGASDSRDAKLAVIHKKVKAANAVARANLEQLSSRGEDLGTLSDNTRELRWGAAKFYANARALSCRQGCCGCCFSAPKEEFRGEPSRGGSNYGSFGNRL